MNEITENIKSIVTVIVISEFLKSFFINENFKKYVSVSINILVLGFLILQISHINFDFDFSFDNIQNYSYENMLSKQYEKDIEENLKKEYEKENIKVEKIIIETDEQYNVVSLKIYIENMADYDKVKNITDKTGIENYEIIGKY